MSKAVLEKVLEATRGVGHLATIEGNVPRVRPMSFTFTKGNLFWTSTYSKSLKVDQIARNAHVEISFLDPKAGSARIAGEIVVVSDPQKKAEFYGATPALKEYFKSPEDPDFTMLELKPSSVQVMPPGSMEYTSVKL